MTTPLRILIAEDSPTDAELLTEELRAAGFDPVSRWVDDADGFRAGLLDDPDVVVAGYHLPRFDALTALAMAAELAPEIPVIVVSGVLSEEDCVRSLRRGAVDYLLKDRLTRLGPAVRDALAHRRAPVTRRSQDRPARNAATLAGIVDGSPSPIYLVDRRGRFVLVNAEFERVFGVARERVVGRRAVEISAELADRFVPRDALCFHQGSVQTEEETVLVGGELRTFISMRYPISPGGASCLTAVYTDISCQKAVEAALHADRTGLSKQAVELAGVNFELAGANVELAGVNVELAGANVELAGVNVELEQLDQLRGRFIATVSHELRTPLTSIVGYTEILAEDETLPRRARRMIAAVDRNGRSLLGLIEQLLTFSEVDAGALRLTCGPVDVTDLVAHGCAAIRPALDDADLTLTVDIQPDLPDLHADREHLERALRNVLGNAVKFSRTGGSIAVAARRTDGPDDRDARDARDTVTISVTDTGIGIPEEEHGQIFGRFFRSSDAERHAIRGTGLGLATCKAIVEAHGGAISLKSVHGQGTTVSMTFPAVAEPRAAAG